MRALKLQLRIELNEAIKCKMSAHCSCMRRVNGGIGFANVNLLSTIMVNYNGFSCQLNGRVHY